MTSREDGDSDWRLPASKTFEGETWHQRKYFAWAENWDHDHCAFCWKSFEVPGSRAALASVEHQYTEGWANESEYDWICDECFTDFRERFHWGTREPSPGDRPDTSPEEADRISDDLRVKHGTVIHKDDPPGA